LLSIVSGTFETSYTPATSHQWQHQHARDAQVISLLQALPRL
jgi:hypothetical protein